MELPFVGPSYNLQSRPSGVQRTINMRPHPQEPGNERTAWVFKDVPGLVLVTTFPTTPTTPTGPVLFLFHMTETATAEGAAEFIGGPTSALDQTGATWTADSTSWLLPASSPSPKFGLFSLGASGGTVWTRDVPQSDPGVPDDYSTASATSLQIDAWVMQMFDDDSGSSFIEVGANAYPFPSSFQLGVNGLAYIYSAFGTAAEDSFVTSNDPIPLNEWVHIRLLCVGQVVHLYINGVEDVSAQIETIASSPITEAGPINLMKVGLGFGVYVDEARAALDVGTSTANFTPPVAPWPNP